MTPKDTLLFWIDLETTGIVPPREGRMLEYHIVLTDLDLNILDEAGSIISQDINDPIAMMNDVVYEMHTNNGLIDEIRADYVNSHKESNGLNDYQYYLDAADRHIASVLELYKDTHNIYAAGSSVHYDKTWVAALWPKVNRLLHYRILDTTAYKVAYPHLFGKLTSRCHRAKDDIHQSIEMQRTMNNLICLKN